MNDTPALPQPAAPPPGGSLPGTPNPLLDKVLAPLSAWYGDPSTIEARMNRPGRVVVERRGTGIEEHAATDITLAVIERICRTLANGHGIPFDGDTKTQLSCVLPVTGVGAGTGVGTGRMHRFECLMKASVQSGLSLAIRCKHPFQPSWEEIGVTPPLRAYLEEAMRARRSIIVSGMSNTGKTTFLNMLLAMLPDHERVIAMEDTPELEMDRFFDGVGLLAGRTEGGSANAIGMVDWRALYDHSTRISPSRIVMGEISTTNSFAALGLLNSGVPGFLCTLHAESPRQALDRKFEQNVAWAGLPVRDVGPYLRELIDIVIQIKRAPDGMRRIADVYEPGGDRYAVRDGAVLLDGPAGRRGS